MQFHLNGFRTGDPGRQATAAGLDRRSKERVDVLIVGCGPAGLTLAAQLSQFPDIHTRIVDRKPGPLEIGQADGVACRTVEMFEAFGFSERVLKEAYWVNETTFWGPSPADPRAICRTGRIQDVADDLSEMPHVILNQARVHDFYLDVMRSSAVRLEPDYDRTCVDLRVEGGRSHPVTVTLKHGGRHETVEARFVVGCDGAHSFVRRAIGRELVGEAANKAWGVMDVLVDTDFPDIRLKSVVRSASEGNVLIIPREGGYLVRFYIELERLAHDKRAKDLEISPNDLIDAANRILFPYRLEVKEVAWWSVYEIGQRICTRFDNAANGASPTVFIAGDACHTHSPKAGQGMNVSMGDAFNLGWKLGAVLRGQSPATLLDTFSAERRAVAQDLVDFDRHWAKAFSGRDDGQPGRDPQAFRDYFEAHGRYTAGIAVAYAPSRICGDGRHQSLAQGYTVGMRFHSAPVTRLWDARPMQLGHCLKADGRWRLMLFNDGSDPTDRTSRLWTLCDRLASDAASPIRAFAASDDDIDAVIDVRAVFQQRHDAIAVESTHPFLTPKKGRYGLADTEKMYCADPAFDLFDRRGLDRARGCLMIVRPDQYVAEVLPLDAFDTTVGFFSDVLMRPDLPGMT
ncbi:MAG: 3-hydroxybenzoate 4-monooxygenase [Boseongicola sp. SB0675_bin_26]|nr:3-hydroxybenzoate 4-monooxygenase [Boseongicola sp. SB0675_bin_26]